MKIAIFTSYLFPEGGACSERITSFARYLSRWGHDVEVVATFPNYPYGRVFKGYINISHVDINANIRYRHNDMALPVKMSSYMAYGKPVVMANDGEVKELIEREGLVSLLKR